MPSRAAAVEENCRARHDSTDVADEDGVLVGVDVLWLDDGSTTASIDMIATDPAHQRRGVGRSRLAHALTMFAHAGVGLVRIGTGGDVGHAPARPLYEAFGFSPLPVTQYYRAL